MVTRECRNGVLTLGCFTFGGCLCMVTKISERSDTCVTNFKCQIISLASFLSSLCHKCFERRSYWRLLWHKVLIAVPYTVLNYLKYINLKLAFLMRVLGFFFTSNVFIASGVSLQNWSIWGHCQSISWLLKENFLRLIVHQQSSLWAY